MEHIGYSILALAFFGILALLMVFGLVYSLGLYTPDDPAVKKVKPKKDPSEVYFESYVSLREEEEITVKR